jgi:hypothetical protein
MKTELHELRLPNRIVHCPVELRARRIVLRPRFGDYDADVFDERDPVFRWLTTIVEQYRDDPRPLYFDYAPASSGTVRHPSEATASDEAVEED